MTNRIPLLRRASIRSALKRIAQRAAARVVGLAVPRLEAHLIRREHREPPRAILVIRLDLLGDVVMSLPVVQAFKESYPNAVVAMLVTPYTAPLLEDVPSIDRVFVIDPNAVRRPRNWFHVRKYRSLFFLIRELRAFQPDIAVSLFGQFACLFAFISGAPTRVGYASEAYPGTLTLALPGRRYDTPHHEVAYVLRLARAAGATVRDNTPRMTASPRAIADIEQQLTGRATGQRPRVVLHVGSNNGNAKRWRMDSWARLADQLVAQYGATVIFSGAARDHSLVCRVRRQMLQPSTNMTGHTDLASLKALLSTVDVVITGDSVPVHLASALGTPVVGIYGPTDPRVYGPYSQPHHVVRAGLPCSPCYNLLATAECPWRVTPAPCMSAVGVEDVLAAVEDIWITNRPSE